MADYKAVVVKAGSGGFGGPLTLIPDAKKNKVVNITGGVMSKVAQTLAEMTGCELVDGFKTRVPDDEILVVVIDCGGTLRCGIYPQKRIYTINLNATGPSGPLAEHIKADIYCSAVKPENISYADGSAAPAPAPAQPAKDTSGDSGSAIKKGGYDTSKKITEQSSGSLMAKIGQLMGGIVSIFYQAGRDSINTIIRTILPFMAFVSMLLSRICFLRSPVTLLVWLSCRVSVHSRSCRRSWDRARLSLKLSVFSSACRLVKGTFRRIWHCPRCSQSTLSALATSCPSVSAWLKLMLKLSKSACLPCYIQDLLRGLSRLSLHGSQASVFTNRKKI